MGTKNNPGNYDCYAKADPDEPLFTLRGKDVSAPYLVELWVAIRRGDWIRAESIVAAVREDPRIRALVGQCEKFDEAESVATEMRKWRTMLNEGIRRGDPR